MNSRLLASVVFAPLALAGTANAQNNVALEEIVVTAQKRSQSVQDVAGAISAITGDQLEDFGLTEPSDLSKIVPNFMTGMQNGEVKLSIRGVGQTVLGAAPGVAVHVDGVYQSQSVMAALVQVDMERVEVARGPQGTLYGRNSAGGVVNYITTAPGEELGGYLQAGVANYDEYNVQGAVDLPMGDRMSARLTGFYNDRGEGLVENVNPNGSGDVNEGNSSMIRLRVDADLGDNVDLSVVGTTASHDGSYVYFQRTGPFTQRGIDNLLIATTAFSRAPGSTVVPIDLGQALPINGNQVSSNNPVDSEKDYTSVSATATVRLSDDISLKSITGYQDFSFEYEGDFDATEFTLTPQQRQRTSEAFTQEINLVVEKDAFSAVLGGFYLDEDTTSNLSFQFANGLANIAPLGVPLPPSLPGLIGPPPLPPGALFFARSTPYENKTAAIFGDVTFNISDRLRLLAGLRYSEDKQLATQFNDIQVQTPGGPVVIPPTLCRALDANGAPIMNAPRVTNTKFTSTTPRVGLQYDVNDNTGIYGTYSQGYKIGGISEGGCQDFYESETVDSFEIGTKNTLADGALSLNATAFYYDYTNLQVQQLIGFAQTFDNAPAAEVLGLELEAAYRVNEKLTLMANGSLQSSEFTEFTNTDLLGTTPGPQDLKGNVLPFSPKVTANVSASYVTDPVIAGGPLTLRANANYRSRTNFREFGNDADSQAAYTLFDASVQWTSPDEGYSIRAYGKNLTDKEYINTITASSLGGVRNGTYGNPRQYGVEVRADF